jgi:hypothetical protein
MLCTENRRDENGVVAQFMESSKGATDVLSEMPRRIQRRRRNEDEIYQNVPKHHA